MNGCVIQTPATRLYPSTLESCEFDSHSCRGVLDTTRCDDCQRLYRGLWFPLAIQDCMLVLNSNHSWSPTPDIPGFHFKVNKIEPHIITEVFKVVFIIHSLIRFTDQNKNKTKHYWIWLFKRIYNMNINFLILRI